MHSWFGVNPSPDPIVVKQHTSFQLRESTTSHQVKRQFIQFTAIVNQRFTVDQHGLSWFVDKLRSGVRGTSWRHAGTFWGMIYSNQGRVGRCSLGRSYACRVGRRGSSDACFGISGGGCERSDVAWYLGCSDRW